MFTWLQVRRASVLWHLADHVGRKLCTSELSIRRLIQTAI
jgi:hypothetical protein